MEVTLVADKLNISGFGSTTQVPNNDIAKLMYYIDCVCTVIDYKKDSFLTDY